MASAPDRIKAPCRFTVPQFDVQGMSAFDLLASLLPLASAPQGIEKREKPSADSLIWAHVHDLEETIQLELYEVANNRCVRHSKKKWWRRRESNPRPQALCPWPYMRIRSIVLTGSNPTDRAH
jgi:hypothetical protein